MAWWMPVKHFAPANTMPGNQLEFTIIDDTTELAIRSYIDQIL
jgi:hypothetical protein